jgi:indole-3-glycerol phosphate synthase
MFLNNMPSFLDNILAQKRSELSALRSRAGSFHKRSSPKRPFIKALDKSPHLAVIAEVKRASPSKGVICKNFEPVAIAEKYEQGGASALSVLTDEKFFQGHVEYLMAVREKVKLPVLRKDFIIDPLQVEETAHSNADAVLFIAEALEASRLVDLWQAARELDIDPFVELHSTCQLDKVMRLEPQAVGINNRDLFTFKTDLGVTLDLVKHIPKEVLVVAESGITGAKEARRLCDAGVRALLVGESLIRAKDVAGLIKELML